MTDPHARTIPISGLQPGDIVNVYPQPNGDIEIEVLRYRNDGLPVEWVEVGDNEVWDQPDVVITVLPTTGDGDD